MTKSRGLAQRCKREKTKAPEQYWKRGKLFKHRSTARPHHGKYPPHDLDDAHAPFLPVLIPHRRRRLVMLTRSATRLHCFPPRQLHINSAIYNSAPAHPRRCRPFSDAQVKMASNGQASTSAKTLAAPSEEQISRISEKLTTVRRRIEAATKAAKRTEEPRLVAISKLHPPTSILAAHLHAEPRQQHFGENYAQELEAKARVLPRSIRWHFVGKLQSNKAKMVASIPNLYMVETLDSIKLANALNKVRSQIDADAPLGVYLQVNTSGEENKGGLEPLLSEGGDAEKSEAVQLAVHVITECKSLELRGLMTIGAAANSRQEHELGNADEDAATMAAKARSQNPDFDTLYRTRDTLVRVLRKTEACSKEKERYAKLLEGDETGGLELSMGMSADLEVAVCAGSSNVRVGTDCFGERPPSRDEAMHSMDEELKSEPWKQDAS